MNKKSGNVRSSIKRWVHPAVRKLNPYHVPAHPRLIKMDAMESPYPLPQTLRKEWLSILEKTNVNRYPDAGSAALKAALRKQLEIPDHCGVLLGNGSDELIQLIALLVGGEGRTIISPTPSFSMYRHIAIAAKTNFHGVRLKDDFSLDGGRFLASVEKRQPACVFIAYPNNPTGNCFDTDVIDRVIEKAPGLVVIDEAYFEFCGKSYFHRIERHPNLIVLRTLSKIGFAGLRLGVLAGSPDWVGELEKLRLPYNINCLTQASAGFFLDHYGVFQEQSAQIRRNRVRMFEQLKSIRGIEGFASETNFILCRANGDGDRVFAELKRKGILVRNLHGSDAGLKNCLRVTVCTEKENSAFLRALESP